MGGGRTRKRTADSRNSSQDGTGSASGSGTLSGGGMDSDLEMPYEVKGVDVPADNLDAYDLWGKAALLHVVGKVRAEVRALRAADLGVPPGRSAADVEALAKRVNGALKVPTQWRRVGTSVSSDDAADGDAADVGQARGALLAALASELGFHRRQAADGAELLAALQKTTEEHTAAVAAGRASGALARRAAMQVPRELEAVRRATRRRSELDASSATARRQADTLAAERQELHIELDAAKLQELETRRRLDRHRLKIAAIRGEMTCPAVNVPYQRVGVDTTEEDTELRLLRNRLDMYDAEAADWEQSLRAITVQTGYVMRSNMLLKHEARLRNSGLPTALPLTRKASAVADAERDADAAAPERPKKKPRKVVPQRIAEAAPEVAAAGAAGNEPTPAGDATAVAAPEVTPAADGGANEGEPEREASAAPKEQASAAQGDAA